MVPYYNDAGSIKELLARVLDSPYAAEIIVVDDCLPSLSQTCTGVFGSSSSWFNTANDLSFVEVSARRTPTCGRPGRIVRYSTVWDMVSGPRSGYRRATGA
jgi:hypothetical protein